MPGGLLNLVSVGQENVLLTGNPKKTFFTCSYTSLLVPKTAPPYTSIFI